MKINEIFFSISSEGNSIGTPAIFIRVSGCNFTKFGGCNYCDTKYAYNEGTEMTNKQIIKEIKKYDCNYIIITGGEPFLYKDEILELLLLLGLNYTVEIETNGSFDVNGFELEFIEVEDNIGTDGCHLFFSVDYKLPSSGMESRMCNQWMDIHDNSHQIKFVISDEIDYDRAKEIIKEYNLKDNIIFQPCWNPCEILNVNLEKLRILIEKVKKDNLNVRILPQLHKILYGNRRGV